jgi:hypothetical protein
METQRLRALLAEHETRLTHTAASVRTFGNKRNKLHILVAGNSRSKQADSLGGHAQGTVAEVTRLNSNQRQLEHTVIEMAAALQSAITVLRQDVGALVESERAVRLRELQVVMTCGLLWFFLFIYPVLFDRRLCKTWRVRMRGRYSWRKTLCPVRQP